MWGGGVLIKLRERNIVCAEYGRLLREEKNENGKTGYLINSSATPDVPESLGLITAPRLKIDAGDYRNTAVNVDFLSCIPTFLRCLFYFIFVYANGNNATSRVLFLKKIYFFKGPIVN